MQFFNQKTFILLIPVLLAVLCYIVHKTIASLKRKRAEELFTNYHKDRIIYFSKEVNFFGQKSDGRIQLRGNGSLLLTPDELHFLRWVPKKNIVISLENIEKVERVNSFLGKSKNRELLKVEFSNQQGEKDSAAWLLNNMHAWEQVIKDNLQE
ncbi:hypothetical protein C8C77_13224 [Halanaerobium saccharolyticum]|uniref:GRAM domain-containing protein n=1 Tax=Halanaerobium saccharolyticum TaxID=43595 RepID=A0A4R7YNH7_9FIRM|nr:hypothetical protein [Halanaerobium saccharolyticum]RAK05191.1 hypothetical protein C7958_12924 [Halanaerobium saccharolyticum]TDV99022.1 hypothetical protein C8C77_13224 [Halanaerobium saccharolyticum]TDX51713.1 hypothetical protein C7956_13124 [Halanaerobium saccharolyticum]